MHVLPATGGVICLALFIWCAHSPRADSVPPFCFCPGSFVLAAHRLSHPTACHVVACHVVTGTSWQSWRWGSSAACCESARAPPPSAPPPTSRRARPMARSARSRAASCARRRSTLTTSSWRSSGEIQCPLHLPFTSSPPPTFHALPMVVPALRADLRWPSSRRVDRTASSRSSRWTGGLSLCGARSRRCRRTTPSGRCR